MVNSRIPDSIECVCIRCPCGSSMTTPLSLMQSISVRVVVLVMDVMNENGSLEMDMFSHAPLIGVPDNMDLVAVFG